MKHRFKLTGLTIVFSLFILTGYCMPPKCTITTANNTINAADSISVPLPIGAQAAKADQSLTLADMLTYAIQDEYLARARYQLVVEKFGTQRPFTNIIQAENTHINALTPLFPKYNVQIPPDNALSYITAPTGLKEAFAAGVQGEIENIEMYNRFLSRDIPEDVRRVFTALRNASQNHLKAFQRGLNR